MSFPCPPLFGVLGQPSKTQKKHQQIHEAFRNPCQDFQKMHDCQHGAIVCLLFLRLLSSCDKNTLRLETLMNICCAVLECTRGEQNRPHGFPKALSFPILQPDIRPAKQLVSRAARKPASQPVCESDSQQASTRSQPAWPPASKAACQLADHQPSQPESHAAGQQASPPASQPASQLMAKFGRDPNGPTKGIKLKAQHMQHQTSI